MLLFVIASDQASLFQFRVPGSTLLRTWNSALGTWNFVEIAEFAPSPEIASVTPFPRNDTRHDTRVSARGD